MKNAQKQFMKILIIFIVYVIVLISSGILFFTLQIDENIKLSLLLIILILALFALFWIKPRMAYHSESYSFYKLKNTQNSQRAINKLIDYSNLISTLKDREFLVFFQNDDFIITHRYTYDRSNLATRRPMLEMFILISNKDLSYKDNSIDKQINLLEDIYYRKKTKITNYTIILIKRGMELSDSIKKECDEVTFSKIRYRSIVTINAFISEIDQSVYFLHSDIYYPNLYYKYATDLINSIII